MCRRKNNMNQRGEWRYGYSEQIREKEEKNMNGT